MSNRLANGTGLVLLVIAGYKATPYCVLRAKTRMQERNIYRALDALCSAALVLRVGRSGRRVYVITESGREMLAR